MSWCDRRSKRGLARSVWGARRRLSAAEILAAGGEVAAMPLLDPRSPRQITDDINALG